MTHPKSTVSVGETDRELSAGAPRLAAFLLPAVLCGAVVLAGLTARLAPRPPPGARGAVPVLETVAPARPGHRVVLFYPDSPGDLARVLDAAWEAVLKDGGVPNLAPGTFPKGMDDLEPLERKRLFLRAVLPHVLSENRHVREDRAKLRRVRERLVGGFGPTRADLALLRELAERYRVEGAAGGADRWGAVALADDLLTRVDVVPPSLALAQAAIESGWGASRLSRFANNLFGQHLFVLGKGFGVPPPGSSRTFGFAEFGDLAEAARAYVRNLNTFWAYEAFRAIRRGMREEGAELDAHRLAEGLTRYSERGRGYVRDVQSMIRENRLTRFDSSRLSRLPEGAWTDVL